MGAISFDTEQIVLKLWPVLTLFDLLENKEVVINVPSYTESLSWCNFFIFRPIITEFGINEYAQI